uniref:Uncharacterized protein n=1 Tax=Anopheles maculatus TaxID=74869 RepID=A0A182S676_9DIPT
MREAFPSLPFDNITEEKLLLLLLLAARPSPTAQHEPPYHDDHDRRPDELTIIGEKIIINPAAPVPFSGELEELQNILHFPEEVALRITDMEYQLFYQVHLQRQTLPPSQLGLIIHFPHGLSNEPSVPTAYIIKFCLPAGACLVFAGVSLKPTHHPHHHRHHLG